ncbi:MAG: FecR family protein [Candidatus Scalindua rubra]|uniref:FecR protein domain-containing protein n=1 Tax=Candidatus Scalindua brodae TaxID=237368 RepID=A0A0B0EKY0_9BACT|nr:MAG: hypothetical protein SCABRO_01546 [Candidatus Scalindua brodae]MBZ0108719.1 FecR family protein [Candidatus Scalindua rubra]TWU31861.1 hypothetical protein S225a_19430 [Candidatus Brocadiaceae bacterium S225]
MGILKYNCLAILIVIISLIFLFFTQKLQSAEERVAVVSGFVGHVEIEHELVWETVTKIGNSMRNSSVYNEDTVMTMSASMADLVFDDNSRLELKEDTVLSISTGRKTKSKRDQEGFSRNISGMQDLIVRNINLKTGGLRANITPANSVLTGLETPAGVVLVSGSILNLIYDGVKTTLEILEGLVAFTSKGNEIMFEMETGEKVNIFYPGGGRASAEVKVGIIDVRTKFGTVKVEAGKSVGVCRDAETGEVTIIAEIGTISNKTTAGTVTIKTSASLTVKEDSNTGEIKVTNTDGNVTITTIDGVTTKVAAGNSIGPLFEGGPITEYAALIPGREAGFGAIDHGNNSILHQPKDEDVPQKHVKSFAALHNDTAPLRGRLSSRAPSTNYLLDFARKIRGGTGE